PTEVRGAGVVFHPGARVDPRAYLALLRPLAERGHLVVVVKAPFDFGLLAVGAAGAAADAHLEVDRWVVGGHSLGGVAAARFAAGGDPRVRGVLFWASYPADDLSGSGLAVASVSGGRDGLTTPQDVAENRPLLPPGAELVVVPGAVHAHFGDYGPQPGDGRPGVDRETAQAEIVSATIAFVDDL
ncbi:MAG TPA: alpha/beta hydrolase, partial [Pseudonocardia sp.]|nr:alpha/beta hydrolase [Pseudonocardia sp.]